ncbi:hypothetical protein [Sporomusa paucivorans]|uniref:hypothetical protein n=1 Tax=Sporomusa paucivorans TaxID=2376 RepID=UPI003570E35E
MSVIDDIESGKLIAAVWPFNRDFTTEESRKMRAELLRLAKIGQFYDTLKNKDFDDLMKRVDKPGKTLNLSDLNLLVGFAAVGAVHQELVKTAHDAKELLRAECEECASYVAGICVSSEYCDVLRVANKLDELLPQSLKEAQP